MQSAHYRGVWRMRPTGFFGYIMSSEVHSDGDETTCRSLQHELDARVRNSIDYT